MTPRLRRNGEDNTQDNIFAQRGPISEHPKLYPTVSCQPVLETVLHNYPPTLDLFRGCKSRVHHAAVEKHRFKWANYRHHIEDHENFENMFRNNKNFIPGQRLIFLQDARCVPGADRSDFGLSRLLTHN